jgi:hypothetical protein
VTPFVILFTVAAALVALAMLQWQRRSRRQTYIESYGFPPGVRQRVRKRYPHLTDAQLELMMQALREYFHLCRKAGNRLLAIPSQVVDAAWHELILFTRNYRAFCQRALGRFLHHTPTTEASTSPTQASEGIQRTCLRARRRIGTARPTSEPEAGAAVAARAAAARAATEVTEAAAAGRGLALVRPRRDASRRR